MTTPELSKRIANLEFRLRGLVANHAHMSAELALITGSIATVSDQLIEAAREALVTTRATTTGTE